VGGGGKKTEGGHRRTENLWEGKKEGETHPGEGRKVAGVGAPGGALSRNEHCDKNRTRREKAQRDSP